MSAKDIMEPLRISVFGHSVFDCGSDPEIHIRHQTNHRTSFVLKIPYDNEDWFQFAEGTIKQLTFGDSCMIERKRSLFDGIEEILFQTFGDCQSSYSLPAILCDHAFKIAAVKIKEEITSHR